MEGATMKVAMYYNNNNVKTEEKPVPKIGRGEILLCVKASGICGSDVMYWYRKHKVPLVLGHEIAGKIVKVGKGVNKYKTGQRIVAAHHVPCGKCRYCKSGHPTVCDTLRSTNFEPGGFSESVRLPSINVKYGVFPIPPGVSYEEATFTEPLACVLRGQRLSGICKGSTVLVVGSGISGLLHVQVARLNKAKRIIATDIVDFKLKLAKKLGADEIYRTGTVPKAEFVILCTGAENALKTALKAVDRGGTLLIFSATKKGLKIPFPVNEIFWRSEIKILSSYAANPEEHKEALRFIKERKINVRDMITHRLPLTETQKGFKLVAEGRKSVKVIIGP